MRHVLPCLLAVALASPASGEQLRAPAYAPPTPRSRPIRQQIAWWDDLESGAPGWTHGDFSAGLEPAFHIDTYYALSDSTQHEDFSWWCGVLNGDFAGGDGYGNSWDERLELPPIDLGGVTVERVSWGAIKAMYRVPPFERLRAEGRVRSASPVLTFAYRHDTEPGYDFVWVEVESLGAWTKLNQGYSGSSDGWQSTGASGFDLSGYGDPIRIRFRFVSDARVSDEDGSHDSDAGAFHLDNIEVADALTGEIFFRDDCDGGTSSCTPEPLPTGGDYWHLASSSCQAYSDPNVWRVAWPGSSDVRPNLRNWLQTPIIDISGYERVQGCTAFVVFQYFMTRSPSSSAYWAEESTSDGGATWIRRGTWGGHQWTRGYGPCDHNLARIPLVDYAPAGSRVAARWIVYTTEDSELPDPNVPYESAGITIDNTWISVTQFPHADPPPSGTQRWDSIKALYR